TEYVQGQKLHDFLRDGTLTEQQRLHVTKQVKKLLDEMGKYRITHGDLKHTNILITDNGPVLTDLDSMQFHTNKWTYRLRRAKDIGRFEFKT
ncbi:MAG: protein kinase, partial [Sedimentisphaerales bacterium]|nr:protein kinase [Sedimentisphaerales bacterium]